MFNHIKFIMTSSRFYSLSSNKNVEKLVDLFKQYDFPNYYEYMEEKNPVVKNLKRASLLVPITFKEQLDSNNILRQNTYFTFSKRTQNMRYYSDQICFIGGKKDDIDKNELETVLREAHEEAGIKIENLILLARLKSFIGTNFGKDAFVITPIVFYLDNEKFVPKLNNQEVESLIEMPTNEFLIKKHHESNLITVFDEDYFIHYFYSDDVEKRIFGVTSFTCILVSTLLHQKIPEFAIDPVYDITPNTFNQFMEDYVFKKSLINFVKKI